MIKRKRIIAASVIAVLVIGVSVFFFTSRAAAINDDCFSWKFPKSIKIERYDPCSSLTLIKETEGREIKANFVLTRPIIDGGKDYFLGEPEEVVVDDKKVTRYLSDTRNSNSGLGNYHIDYSINYDRIPLKNEKPGGRVFLTAGFVLATKNNSHVSEQEINDFIELTDAIMSELHTK